MTDWIVSRPVIVSHVEAADRVAAEALARRRFGDDVSVQSALSRQISLAESATIARQRRVREDER